MGRIERDYREARLLSGEFLGVTLLSVSFLILPALPGTAIGEEMKSPSPGDTVIQYDDGSLDSLYVPPPNYLAVKFSPQRLCTVKAGYLVIDGNPTCTLFVWDDQGGRPDSLVYSSPFTSQVGLTWDSLPLAATYVDSNEFWIGYFVPTAGNGKVACDTFTNFDRSFASYNCTTWTWIDTVPGWVGDLAIRAVVTYWDDVGVDSIEAPPDTVFTDSTYTPIAWVGNYGSFSESFAVVCSIDSYMDTVQLTGVTPNSVRQVSFDPPWTVPSPDSTTYTMMVRTTLAGDENPANDTLSKDIFAYRLKHDVGVDSILAPPDTVIADSTYTPIATVRNFGHFTESFAVVCSIDSYMDTVQVAALVPGSARQVSFDPPWTVPSPDSTTYTMMVRTTLAGDGNPANDTLSKDIFAYRLKHDVGVDSILAPPDTVIADSTYTPIATVRNFGHFTESFAVVCSIDSYMDTVQVAALVPGSARQVSFDPPWTVPSPDSTTYTMMVRTTLAGDENPANDTLSKDIFAYRLKHDVGVDSILAPPDTVITDSLYAPVARVKNLGQFFTDTFDVECLIDSSGVVIYGDTVGVILVPGDTVSIAFGDWQVPGSDSISYQITVLTLLAEDENPENDTSWKSIFAYRKKHDVGVDSILAPPDTVFADSTYIPMARVRNFGQFFTETFNVACLIDSSDLNVYGDTVTVTNLEPSATFPCTFAVWTVPHSDSTTYKVTFKTILIRDSEPENDSLWKSIFAYILAPEEIIFINYPNPFDPSSKTTIQYCLPYNASVSINIYDVSGQCLKELIRDETTRRGNVRIRTWSGEDHNGKELANGVYIAELIAKRGDREERRFRRVAILSR